MKGNFQTFLKKQYIPELDNHAGRLFRPSTYDYQKLLIFQCLRFLNLFRAFSYIQWDAQTLGYPNVQSGITFITVSPQIYNNNSIIIQ